MRDIVSDQYKSGSISVTARAVATGLEWRKSIFDPLSSWTLEKVVIITHLFALLAKLLKSAYLSCRPTLLKQKLLLRKNCMQSI